MMPQSCPCHRTSNNCMYSIACFASFHLSFPFPLSSTTNHMGSHCHIPCHHAFCSCKRATVSPFLSSFKTFLLVPQKGLFPFFIHLLHLLSLQRPPAYIILSSLALMMEAVCSPKISAHLHWLPALKSRIVINNESP